MLYAMRRLSMLDGVAKAKYAKAKYDRRQVSCDGREYNVCVL